MMDVDANVDSWLLRFSPGGGSKFPFSAHKIQAIESRRARMSDRLIFDVLLVHGGVRNPDMLFPPTDWQSLRKLLGAIDQSEYDILKKDCLVYMLLKWAWDLDSRETNPGWDTRYIQDRCIFPQFAALADAYWLLDTGTHLSKAVSILADARLNRDYVTKILQALALSSSPASLASGTAPATASLIVNYIRTAKPLLTEPDDMDLYALSLAHLSFVDAWSYQKSFPEGSDIRERLLGKLVAWSLMPKPKQEPLAQLVALPLSSYEQSALYSLAVPTQFSTSVSLSNLNAHPTTTSGPALSSNAISILQDLLCVRAIQSGDYVRAIKLDHQFSSISPSLGSAPSSSSIASQATSSGRDIDRKSIIQDLFASLPPAERTLLEDELGKVATGVRANFTPKQRGVAGPARRPPIDAGLSASWEDVGASTRSPVPHCSVPVALASPAVEAGFTNRATLTPVASSTAARDHQSSISGSPFASHVPRRQPQAPPKSKFTVFGSPISSAKGGNSDRMSIVERGKMLFGGTASDGSNAVPKLAARTSLFDTAGSAKNAQNAFYKPPQTPIGSASLSVGSVLAGSSTVKSPGHEAVTAKRNGKAKGGEDVNMEPESDAESIEEGRRDESRSEGREEQELVDVDEEEDAEIFITHDQSDAADLTLHPHYGDELMSDVDEDGMELEFSVFGRDKNAVHNTSTSTSEKKAANGNGHLSRASPPSRVRVAPYREADKSLSLSANSTMTTASRRQALPGAFDDEDDEGEGGENRREKQDDGEEDDLASFQTAPLDSLSPRRSARRRTQTHARAQTPPRPTAPSQSRRRSKGVAEATTHTRRSPRAARTSSRLSTSQPIPGSLMDDDEQEHHVQDHHHSEAEHTDAQGGDEDTEMEMEEEDAVAPLPSRGARRTRSSGVQHAGVSLNTAGTAKTTKTATGATTTTMGGAAAKGKTRTRRSIETNTKTPVRRSSRLSLASSMSPEQEEEHEAEEERRYERGPPHKREHVRDRERVETGSPTKKGRKGVVQSSSRTSMGASGTAMPAATRSSTRRHSKR